MSLFARVSPLPEISVSLISRFLLAIIGIMGLAPFSTQAATSSIELPQLPLSYYRHTDSVILPDGDILTTGGSRFSHSYRFSPSTGTFSRNGHAAFAIGDSTLTLLPNGKVLRVGGEEEVHKFNKYTTSSPLAEIYDPEAREWSATSPLLTARQGHTATLLANGKVLVVGGRDGAWTSTNYLSSAELFDPTDGTWSSTGSLSQVRSRHTATLLPSGKVLVTGGLSNYNTSLDSAEIYDPVTGLWSSTGSMATTKERHNSTLLPNGKVLVVHWWSAELYDPATGLWSPAAAMPDARANSTATLLPNGKVLLIGGKGSTSTADNPNAYTKTSLTYDPDTNSWELGGDLILERGGYLSSALLQNGKILVFGGDRGSIVSSHAEVFDPMTSESALASQSDTTSLYDQTSSLLPNGNVLVDGNQDMRIYETATDSWSTTLYRVTRYDHTATHLADGRVLLAGGRNEAADPQASCRLFDSTTNNFLTVGSLATAREKHTATLLSNRKIFVTGGYNGSYLASSEIFDSETGVWTSGPAMSAARRDHTSTELPDGKVLVTGGFDNGTHLRSAEIFDPSTSSWSSAGNMITSRNRHQAILMQNGKVLIIGGHNGSSVSHCEIYDPASNTWTATDSMSNGRSNPIATQLPNGLILVTGGRSGDSSLASAEIYDPTYGKWLAAADLKFPRHRHAATLLKSGKILITGGRTHGRQYRGVDSDVEIYDPNVSHASLRPQISSASIDGNGRLVISGSQFHSTLKPTASVTTVRWRNGLDGGTQGVLTRDPSTSSSDTTFIASAASTALLPEGYNFIEVVTNAATSEAVQLFTPSPDMLLAQPAGAPVGVDGARSFQVIANILESAIFTITNPGTADLSGISVTIDGPDAATFSLSASPASSIPPGGSTTFTVGILSTSSGSKNATLRIANNTSHKPSYDISLSAVTLPADIVVEYPAGTNFTTGGVIAFSKTLLGNPTEKTITIKNSGEADLSDFVITKSGTNAADITVTIPPSSPVAPGGSTSFTVQFSPSSSGAKTASIQLASNDPDESSFSFNFTGEGIALNSLAGADLTGADFSNADLSGANLAGADFTNADLSNAILTGANITGTDFTNTTLTGLRSGGLVGTPTGLAADWLLSFEHLIGPSANLVAADLSGQDLSGINFSGVNTNGADLTGAFAIVNTSSDELNTPSGATRSLREVLRDAPAELLVLFDASLSGATIVQTDWNPAITQSITIDASALADGITLNGGYIAGVLDISAGATVQLINLRITNGVGFPNGAVQNYGVLTVIDSEISGNTGEVGAGIYNEGTLNLHNCVIASNDAMFEGGGLANFGTATLNNVTITANSCDFGTGGGITNGGPLTLNHCTIARNSADSGGGIDNIGPHSVSIYNTILSDNTATTGADLANSTGTITTTGVNLISDLSGSSLSVGSAVITGPSLLAPFGDYGGGTSTMPPLPGSLAIEGGQLLPGQPTTDQRGLPRPLGLLPDIGAVEADSLFLGTLTDSDSDGVPDLLESTTYPQFTVGVDDSNLDTDGDGSPDAVELANMTSPSDASDFLRISSFDSYPSLESETDLTFVATAKTFPGLSYTLETSDDLDFSVELIPDYTFIANGFEETFLITFPGDKGFVRFKRVEQ